MIGNSRFYRILGAGLIAACVGFLFSGCSKDALFGDAGYPDGLSLVVSGYAYDEEETDAPIPGLKVVLAAFVKDDAVHNPVMLETAYTGPDGRFSIECSSGVEFSHYRIDVTDVDVALNGTYSPNYQDLFIKFPSPGYDEKTNTYSVELSFAMKAVRTSGSPDTL